MIRKHKKYSRPKKPYDKIRIQEEHLLIEKYGLKNKKEIWKADAAIARIRNRAKKLITKSEEEKQKFVEKLQKQGFKINTISDALGLDKEDYLKRRLQTIVFEKKLANSPKQARQLIVHKHVSIGNQIVSVPSYLVNLEEEPKIKLNIVLKIKEINRKSKIENIKDEIEDIENKDLQEEIEEMLKE
ncbi:MAG: 30S ribosomal protein S4 [Candidatus Pacearchaeota archaeon]